MGFIERNLTTNETIVYRGKLHWLVFWKPIAVTLAIILATLITGYFTYNDNPDLTMVIGGIIILVSIITCSVIVHFYRKNREYIVTTRRVIIKTGIIRRQLAELSLEKCEGLFIDQGFMQRMLNYGTIVITTGDVRNEFAYLSNPVAFRKHVNECIDKLKAKNTNDGNNTDNSK
ncbi:MAG: PH domain-containing protein [Bacteroidaceae bacterium]|nr:PH domain-containing protein [Bacteroidaceae bacterium]